MRSHPYTPAPPLPPLLDHLSTYLPNAAGPRRPATAESTEYHDDDDNDGAVALVDLDPATSRLLPRPRYPHRVRVQGRLAVVRSVSVANLRGPGNPRLPPPSTSSSSSAASGLLPSPRRCDGVIVGSPRQQQRARRRRRRSLDDGEDEASEEDEAAVREVRRKDAQLRSYGIGGAGNIRRPTDVIGTSTREPSTLGSFFSSSNVRFVPDDRKWHWASFLGRVSDRKVKGAAHNGG